MKIYEAPNLPRGEKLPEYVEMWVKTIFAELSNVYRSHNDNFLDDTEDKVWHGIKSLMYQAIEALAEKAYVLATKNIEEKDGLFVTSGNRMKLNKLKDGLQRIGADKKKERFEFVVQNILRGAGFGHNVSLTTIVDAFRQDQAEGAENSIVQTYLAEQDKKTGKFPNADKLIYKLIEKHRTEINLENCLTPENALVLPPVFLKTESGKPVEYKIKDITKKKGNVKLQVFQLTKPEDLELETYVQDICIGDDAQGYKESMVKGDMLFFSVSRVLGKPIRLSDHIELYKNKGAYETQYWAHSTNPHLQEIKATRHPEITISAYVNGKNLTFDQIKLFEDEVLDMDAGDTKGLLAEVFLYEILPNLCEELQKQGYVIKSFGDDVDDLIPDLPVNSVWSLKRNKIVRVLDLEEEELFMDGGAHFEVHMTMSKDDIERLQKLPINFIFKPIACNEEFFTQVKGKISYAQSIQAVNLINLETVESVTATNAKDIYLPKLKEVQSANGCHFDYVLRLDLRSLKKFKTNITWMLHDARFDSLEETGNIILAKRQVDKAKLELNSSESEASEKIWQFPSLKKAGVISNIREPAGTGLNSQYNLPELVECEELKLKNVESHVPNLRKLKKLHIMDTNISLPNLESCDEMFFANTHGAEKPMFVDLSKFDFNNLKVRSGLSVGFDKNIFFIVSDPEKAREIMNGTMVNTNMKVQLPPENFFRSKGEYLVKTGKYWGQQ